MADSTGQSAPAISAPVIIVVSILGAVVVVVVTAALYRLCRRATVDTNEDVGDKRWNPNQRPLEQVRYMEEVRMRNKMFAWDRSRAGGNESHQPDHFGRRYDNKEGSEEEYFADVLMDNNPYEEIVNSRQSNLMVPQSPKRSHKPCIDNVVQPEIGALGPAAACAVDDDMNPYNSSGIQIKINGEYGEIDDANEVYSPKYPPRRSRMFRSSSIYSGDQLLPSTHLHLVQSSSKYALGPSGKLHP